MQDSDQKHFSIKGLNTRGIPLAPLFFSLGIHIIITCIILVPTSFFHHNTMVEVYSVELVNLSEPQQEPEQSSPPALAPTKPKPIESPAVSTKPILSTRTIPTTPTEIKILRPRMTKQDIKKDKPPIDQTMVLAALPRLQQKETEQKAQKQLDEANKAIEQANEEMLMALRESILSRQPQNTGHSNGQATANTHQVNQNSNTPGGASGQRANSIRTQYIATIGHHIGQQWRLPEGQKWNRNLKTIVIVKIKSDGIVLSSQIEESSKSKQFDKFVLETIDKASPLPPFPQSLDNKPLKLYFHPQGLQ